MSRRERVELEARSVIRQVGIHIYRVVKSIGVSVSRVSCKETLVGMRCEPIGRRRAAGGREGWGGHQAGKRRGSSPRHQTDEDRTQTPFPLPARFPFDPFCCFAIHHPLPPHVSSPCILILPIIPTSQFGQPFGSGCLATLSLPPPSPVERAKGNQNKQGKEEPVRWWAEKGGKGIAASYRLGFLSKPGF